MPGETTTQTIDDNQPSVQDGKPTIHVEVWDTLPGDRRVAKVERGGEVWLVARRGQATPEFLLELEGIMQDGVTSETWSQNFPATGEDRGHQAA